MLVMAKALVCRDPLLLHHSRVCKRRDGRRACPDDAHAAAAAAVGRLEHDGGGRAARAKSRACPALLMASLVPGTMGTPHSSAAARACVLSPMRCRQRGHASGRLLVKRRAPSGTAGKQTGHPKPVAPGAVATKAGARHGARHGGDAAAFPRLCPIPHVSPVASTPPEDQTLQS